MDDCTGLYVPFPTFFANKRKNRLSDGIKLPHTPPCHRTESSVFFKKTIMDIFRESGPFCATGCPTPASGSAFHHRRRRYGQGSYRSCLPDDAPHPRQGKPDTDRYGFSVAGSSERRGGGMARKMPSEESFRRHSLPEAITGLRLSGSLPDISDSRPHPKTHATKSKPMSNERLLWVR